MTVHDAPLPSSCLSLLHDYQCYGIINGATAFLAFKKEDTFQPSWRWYDWRLSTFGACQVRYNPKNFPHYQWISTCEVLYARFIHRS